MKNIIQFITLAILAVSASAQQGQLASGYTASSAAPFLTLNRATTAQESSIFFKTAGATTGGWRIYGSGITNQALNIYSYQAGAVVGSYGPSGLTITGSVIASGSSGSMAINRGGATPPPQITNGGGIQIVGATSENPAVQLISFGGNPTFRVQRANGTPGSPTAVISGDSLGFFTGAGYGATQYPVASTGAVAFVATENFTDTANGTKIQLFATPNGSVTRAVVAEVLSTGLSVTGTISASGLVTVGGSTPASASAAGTAGTITWDSSYIYVCVSENTWKRVAISTW